MMILSPAIAITDAMDAAKPSNIHCYFSVMPFQHRIDSLPCEYIPTV